MNKKYILILLCSLYQSTELITVPGEEINSYRAEFNDQLNNKRKEENEKTTEFHQKKLLEEQRKIEDQGKIEDHNLRKQQAIENNDTETLTQLRKQEDLELTTKREQENLKLTTKREQEDKERFSTIKKFLWRDRERAEEDKKLQDQRKEEDAKLNDQRAEEDKELAKPRTIVEITIDPTEKNTLKETGHSIDLLLINQDIKNVISKIVDINSYQTLYHNLATGKIDIQSLQSVQESLKTDIKLSSEDLKIIKKYQQEINQILENVQALFDTKNNIYKKVEDTLKKQNSSLTLSDLPTLLNQSIDLLKKINLDVLTNIPKEKAWYVFKETVLALVTTPFVVAGAGMFAGKAIGLWTGAAAGTIAGISGVGVGAIPGYLVGGAMGDVAGALIGAKLGFYVGIAAAPFVAAARFREVVNNYEYTIPRNQNTSGESKNVSTSGESKKSILRYDDIWKKITPDDYFKHEKIFLGIFKDFSKLLNPKWKRTSDSNT